MRLSATALATAAARGELAATSAARRREEPTITHFQRASRFARAAAAAKVGAELRNLPVAAELRFQAAAGDSLGAFCACRASAIYRRRPRLAAAASARLCV